MDSIIIIPEYAKSKEEIWDEAFAHLEKPDRKKVFFRRIPIWAYAASFLMPILTVCLFYTKTVETAKGEHRVFMLPDRSTVTMNAESKLSYRPFLWLPAGEGSWNYSKRLGDRTVKMDGEACFEVRTGNRFRVLSGVCRVEVTGTAFNVYSRDGVYSVTCLEGQVEVHAERESIVLHPNMQATLRVPQFSVKNDVIPSTATGWIQGRFVFDETPLQEVVAEVERQYNIRVAPATYPNRQYTGRFLKTDEPETVLEAIGMPFGIKFSIE